MDVNSECRQQMLRHRAMRMMMMCVCGCVDVSVPRRRELLATTTHACISGTHALSSIQPRCVSYSYSSTKYFHETVKRHPQSSDRLTKCTYQIAVRRFIRPRPRIVPQPEIQVRQCQLLCAPHSSRLKNPNV